jgi:hypothetical protein
MRNCLVAGNQTAANGGGVYLTAAGGNMINCTIVRNYSAASGGGCIYVGPGIGKPITNVIVSGNQAAVSTNDIGSFTAIGYSCGPELTAGGSSSNLTSDPLFVNAGSGYGTNAVLGDYTLQTNSPCIGAGYNASWMTVDPKVDLAGNNRIRPAWGTVDMGAYEALPFLGALSNSFTASPVVGASPLPVVFSGETSGNTNGLVWQWIFGDGTTNDWSVNGVVTNTYAARSNAYTVILNVTNAGGEWVSKTNLNYIQVYPVMAYVATNGLHVSPFETWGNAATNIQVAVDVAGAGYTVAVLVSNGVYTVTTVTNGITINKGITLRGFSGNWADTVIKGGFPASTNRCLTISGAGAVVDGFTITNGNLGANSLAGGGVNMSAGTVQNCLIIGNVANGISANAGNGAGIYSSGGNVFNCTIKRNVSMNQDGGGIFSAGVVSNCLITGNSTPGRGGGFRMSGAAIMDRCVISNNTAASNGGGIFKSNTGIGTIRNTLVAGNQSQALGGGLYCDTIPVSLENCTVVGNLAANGGGVYAFIAVLAATNCIIINNLGSAAGGTNELGGIAGNFAYSCSSDLVNGENNNINANPMFVRAGSGYGTNWA